MSFSKVSLALAGACLAFFPLACKSTESSTNVQAAECCKDGGNAKAECCKDGKGDCCQKKAGTMNVAAPAPKGECPAAKTECEGMKKSSCEAEGAAKP